MNNIKLKSLKLGDICIHFKSGLNYILGGNATGKTTIFNAIRYAIGLESSLSHSYFFSVELDILINDLEIRFFREVGSLYIKVYDNEESFQIFKAESSEWDNYLKEQLAFKFIYQSSSESAQSILDFCFLSEVRSINRRKQWEAVNSICGINTSMFRLVERDIMALRKEVAQNKIYKSVIDAFSNRLLDELEKDSQLENSTNRIEKVKEEFLKSYKDKENLLLNAMLKFDELKKTSSKELANKLSEIESIFININKHHGFNKSEFEGLEIFIKERSHIMSFGAETYSRFLIILSVAIFSENTNINFPNFIINDNYLSSNDDFTYSNAITLLENVVNNNENLQYIEFTNRRNVPSEYVVLDLNTQGIKYEC